MRKEDENIFWGRSVVSNLSGISCKVYGKKETQKKNVSFLKFLNE